MHGLMRECRREPVLYATLLALAIIGKSLKHESQQATAIHVRLDLDPVRAAVNTATNALLEAGVMKTGADAVQIKKKVT